jgi:glycerol-3-phosphate dehydrogenase
MRNLNTLADGSFDVIVVGAGITGAFAAWDLALRGLSVALLERSDFGAATSAHSLKFVHGGIRYLQHLDIRRVRESSRERATLLRIAPHLVRAMPVVVPCYGHGMKGPEVFRAAFQVLGVIAPDRNAALPDPARRMPKGRILSRAECLRRYPDLESAGLTGGAEYYDGHIYNPPRLIYNIVKSASRAGALAANYCEVTGLLQENRHVIGVTAVDRETGAKIHVHSKVILNCAGPFAEQLNLDMGVVADRQIPLSRDMAVVVTRNLTGDTALAVQTRYRDPDALLSRGNRHLFMVPWREYTLIGVNSKVYTGNPYALDITEVEVQGFLDEINEVRPAARLGLQDVGVVNYGLLPFGENIEGAKHLSFGKRSPLVDHGARAGPNGLITAMSVRLTMGRAIAEAAVDLAFRKLDVPNPPVCTTMETPIAGGNIDSLSSVIDEVKARLPAGVDLALAESLARNHGSEVPRVLELIEADSDLEIPLAGSTVLGAEVVKAVRDEQVLHLADVVLRRTDLGTGERPRPEALDRCARLMAVELGWNDARLALEVEQVMSQYPGYTA